MIIALDNLAWTPKTNNPFEKEFVVMGDIKDCGSQSPKRSATSVIFTCFYVCHVIVMINFLIIKFISLKVAVADLL